jgi:hypothetical protein
VCVCLRVSVYKCEHVWVYVFIGVLMCERVV